MPTQRNALAALATRPRVRLDPLPTPLQRAPRLGDALGVDLWIKRDDIGSLGLAGNKVRKLEFALGEALANGADCIVTCGAAQSNHMRATAAAAAQLGLRAILVVRGERDDLKGAVIVVGADGIIRDIATTGSCDTADGLCAPRALWAGPNGLLTADPAAHRVLSLGSAATPWPAATVPGGSTPPFPAAVTALTARRRGAELMLRFSAPPGRLKVAVRVGKRWMTVRRGRTTARLSKVKVSLRGARRRARSVRITVVTTTGVSVSRTVAVPAR